MKKEPKRDQYSYWEKLNHLDKKKKIWIPNTLVGYWGSSEVMDQVYGEKFVMLNSIYQMYISSQKEFTHSWPGGGGEKGWS